MPADLTSGDILAAITPIVTAAAPKALIIPRPLFGLENDEADVTPDLFRSDLDAGRIHVWMFWRGPIVTDRVPKGVDFTVGHAARAYRYDKTWTYNFRFYLSYATGNDADNSKAEFDNEIDAVVDALAIHPKLGLDNTNLRQHDDLQFTQAAVVRQLNDLYVHVGFGRLDVHLIKSLTSTAP